MEQVLAVAWLDTFEGGQVWSQGDTITAGANVTQPCSTKGTRVLQTVKQLVLTLTICCPCRSPDHITPGTALHSSTRRADAAAAGAAHQAAH
jgi:hypothetical protein